MEATKSLLFIIAIVAVMVSIMMLLGGCYVPA